MFWASYLLATLAIILAWPAPVALSRARWPARAPFTALILWQSIALAGGLSMIGAMLVWGLEPLGDNLVSAAGGFWNVARNQAPAGTLGVVHVFALSAAFLLGAHLIFTLMLTYVRIRRQRRRHRDLLGLLSSPALGSPATLVINHPAPVAYCLPGGARSVTVLSDSLLDLLTREELDAVLTHERAHLHQRHHLLLWAFAAWRAALPWLPTSLLAQRAVNELIEMLADDEALKHVKESTLVRAIAIVASGSPPPASLEQCEPPATRSAPVTVSALTELEPGTASTLEATAQRLSRLLTPLPPLSVLQRNTVLGTSALLLTVPPILLVAPELLG
ncbi:M48 family metalloprotease [Arthrobacter sp. Br18]|uniref:M48 family metalloprotease n=1 Tax=Arthrobacter sp. Br18 TaxID=1312954 RepID=UPI00047CB45D|nr:M48 family metalloprotease [Arthrobacter sp. Br18]